MDEAWLAKELAQVNGMCELFSMMRHSLKIIDRHLDAADVVLVGSKRAVDRWAEVVSLTGEFSHQLSEQLARISVSSPTFLPPHARAIKTNAAAAVPAPDKSKLGNRPASSTDTPCQPPAAARRRIVKRLPQSLSDF